jgi:hypothetical protein
MGIGQMGSAVNGGFISVTGAAEPAEKENPRKNNAHPAFPVCPNPAICLSPTHCANRSRAQTACKLRGRPWRHGIRSLTLTLIFPREEEIEN